MKLSTLSFCGAVLSIVISILLFLTREQGLNLVMSLVFFVSAVQEFACYKKYKDNGN